MEKVWTYDNVVEDAKEGNVYLENLDQATTLGDYFDALAKYLLNFKKEKVDTTRLERALKEERKHTANKIAIPLDVKGQKQKSKQMNAIRDHFLHQLLNLINDKDAFFYINLKLKGRNAAIDPDTIKIIESANDKKSLEKAYLPALHFVENEDRYREKKFAPGMKSQFEETIKDANDAYIIGNISQKRKNMIQIADDYDDEIEKIENIENSGDDDDDDGARALKENQEERLELLQADYPEYDEVVKLIKNFDEWMAMNDENFRATWDMAFKEWKKDKDRKDASKKGSENTTTEVKIRNPQTKEQLIEIQRKQVAEEKKLKDEKERLEKERTEKQKADQTRLEKERLEKDAEEKNQKEKKALEEKQQQERDKLNNLSIGEKVKELEAQLKKSQKLASDNMILAQTKNKELIIVNQNMKEKDIEIGKKNSEISKKSSEIQRLTLELEKLNDITKKGTVGGSTKSLKDEEEIRRLQNELEDVRETNRLLLDGDDNKKKLNNALEVINGMKMANDKKGQEIKELETKIKEMENANAKQEKDISILLKLKKKKIDQDGLYKDSKKTNNNLFVLVEKKDLKSTMARFAVLNQLSYVDINGNELKFNSRTIATFPQSLYNLSTKEIREKLNKALAKYKAKGVFGSSMTLSDQIQNAVLESHFETAYGGKDRLRLTFKDSSDGVISVVNISNLATQSFDPSGKKHYIVPLHDTESYDQVYEKISSLGKGVIELEGKLEISRDGFEPLGFTYRMDYDDHSGDMYYGRGFVFPSDDGIRLHTKFMNKENHQSVSLIIPEDLFRETPHLFVKKSLLEETLLSHPLSTTTDTVPELNSDSLLTKKSLLEETSLSLSASGSLTDSFSEDEHEVFEVPIYQETPIKSVIERENEKSLIATEEEESEWPSDF